MVFLRDALRTNSHAVIDLVHASHHAPNSSCNPSSQFAHSPSIHIIHQPFHSLHHSPTQADCLPFSAQINAVVVLNSDSHAPSQSSHPAHPSYSAPPNSSPCGSLPSRCGLLYRGYNFQVIVGDLRTLWVSDESLQAWRQVACLRQTRSSVIMGPRVKPLSFQKRRRMKNSASRSTTTVDANTAVLSVTEHKRETRYSIFRNRCRYLGLLPRYSDQRPSGCA